MRQLLAAMLPWVLGIALGWAARALAQEARCDQPRGHTAGAPERAIDRHRRWYTTHLHPGIPTQRATRVRP